jgi:dTDP-glucose 4,6-dehydratase
VEKICAKLGANFADSVQVVGERLGKDAAYLLDSTKLRETLAWQDQVSLDAGLDECIAWVRANLDALQQQPQSYVHKA